MRPNRVPDAQAKRKRESMNTLRLDRTAKVGREGGKLTAKSIEGMLLDSVVRRDMKRRHEKNERENGLTKPLSDYQQPKIGKEKTFIRKGKQTSARSAVLKRKT